MSSQKSEVSKINNKKDICRDFLWGCCSKGPTCKFRHELILEDMKKTLIFCHDFQNHGCTRKDCSFLHASREEQNLFEVAGQLPEVLVERYRNMSMTSGETIPQIAMYIRESLAIAPPPPPPPPPLPATNNIATYGPSQSKFMGPGSHSVMATVGPHMAPVHTTAVMPPIHPAVTSTSAVAVQHLPPPPPPPVQNCTSEKSFKATSHTGALATHPINNQLPGFPAKFDTSKPPPILPAQLQSRTGKRKLADSEAEPSKVRKDEETKEVANSCGSCSQRECRINLYKKKLDEHYIQEENLTLIYTRKLEEYQRKMDLLKTFFSPVIYSLLVDYIEKMTQYHVGVLNKIPRITQPQTLPEELVRTLLTSIRSAPSTSNVNNIQELLTRLSEMQNVQNTVNDSQNRTLGVEYSYTNGQRTDAMSTRQNSSQVDVNQAHSNRTTTSMNVPKTMPSIYSVPPPNIRSYLPQPTVPPTQNTATMSGFNQQHNYSAPTTYNVTNCVPSVTLPPANNREFTYTPMPGYSQQQNYGVPTMFNNTNSTPSQPPPPTSNNDYPYTPVAGYSQQYNYNVPTSYNNVPITSTQPSTSRKNYSFNNTANKPPYYQARQ
ncbi:uncharacterized protein LOC126978968 isoform X2 [Leptidea sinapis]|uniref:uncharacterized protein LOC126978968 isoform X2 n=1 Tax=Leptidea sinapis TaxID=189913 RepID=UPI002123FD3F|nr:uncharacterized protein LOC126978968 isoform X2 [Leptidea sinapis]